MEFVQHFNSFNPQIQFTVENENENKLPFLDVLLHRNDDGTIEIDWYHKKTWSGRYLNFKSWLPVSYKWNTITILAKKILLLSDKKFHTKNFRLLTDTLLDNSYPIKMIKRGIKNAHLNNLSTTNHPNQNQRVTENFCSIPYAKHLFEKIKQLLSHYNIKTVGRGHNNLGKTVFSKTKDETPKEMKTHIVYRSNCGCGSKYIGQTKQNLRSRVYQHIRDSKKPKKENEGISALSAHIRDCPYSMSIDNFEILDYEVNLNKRRVLEMIRIKQHPDNINIQTDTDYLNNNYDFLL